jgi:hypothetical protein
MKNCKTDRLSRKLTHQMAGSYQILEKIDNSYKIDLPASIKIHLVMSPDRLRKTVNDSLSEQYNNSLSTIKIDKEDE